MGAGAQKKASRTAEAQQIEYLNRALGLQESQYNQDRADFAPFREAGGQGLAGILDLIGLNGPEAQAAAVGMVEGGAGYQRQIENGTEGVLQNAAATGGLRGGNTQRGLADFRADTLAQAIQQQLAAYGGLSGAGLSATGAGSQAGGNLTQLMAQNLGSQGQVRAGGTLTRGGINAGIWNSAGGFLSDLAGMIPGVPKGIF